MKIESSPIKYTLGENKSPLTYKIHFILADEKDNPLLAGFQDQWKTGKFRGESKQKFVDETSKTILLGLGKLENLPLRNVAGLFIDLGKNLRSLEGVGYEIFLRQEITSHYDPERLVYQIVNSIDLGYFDIRVLATKDQEKKKPGSVSFQTEEISIDKKILSGIKKAQAVSKQVNGARYIAHLPSNYFRPQEFEERSREIAKDHKLKITVFNEPQLKKMGMNGILAVSRGTDNAGKMIILDYNPPGAKKTFAIVGKGLTFDTGGISLKPPSEMHEMKYDMCGASATIHAIAAIASLKTKIRVVAAIGTAENMPDGRAYKPGDVYTAYNGLTVEVQNTDAEGRLVLGDVLSYVCDKIKPDYMVDLATLTGAAIMALGHETAALLSKNSDFVTKIKQASELSDDRVWELPLWDEYGEGLKSDIADLRNIAGGKGAGTISAGIFLSHFVDKDIPWAHLDIAGTAWRKKGSGTQTSGPTGYGVRLLVELAEILSK
jgi:leucyl aminopeptidase